MSLDCVQGHSVVEAGAGVAYKSVSPMCLEEVEEFFEYVFLIISFIRVELGESAVDQCARAAISVILATSPTVSIPILLRDSEYL